MQVSISVIDQYSVPRSKQLMNGRYTLSYVAAAVIVALLTVVGIVVVFRSQAAAAPIRLAFYYPWFPETWGSLSPPDTHYHPSAGFYSSDDANVIKQHVTAMQYAHLDAAISSWWGQGQHSEN